MATYEQWRAAVLAELGKPGVDASRAFDKLTDGGVAPLYLERPEELAHVRDGGGDDVDEVVVVVVRRRHVSSASSPTAR